ncbi:MULTISPECIES: YheC/YheD family protein [Paenibacillus]|uniref:YheC/YheD family protein n=1 Tax=Paenibacillus violae TaxID=3077234 RepID=A0ABU3R693_9BACL|nr:MULTISPECIES: YheC/YheD family protein [Paenibacillus]MDU0199781.1 YheC/YheD family protein [Paenibacillus sp. PFR10]MEC0268004.1 YheC/YheD family protein [Paenibacillus anseongense]
MSKLSTSKWTKYKLLRKSEKLRVNLPETEWLKESSFWRLLNKYEQVIIKPTGSYGGHGVIRIKKSGNSEYELQDGAKKKRFTNQDQVNAFLKKKNGKNFIVQQRISLATVNGRPFDLRVMVQRHPHSKWQVTGKLAKVAGAGFIVTNIRMSSGKVVSVEHALKHSQLKSMRSADLLAQLDKVALKSAATLGPSYRWVKTMGIDMAFDKAGHVWIIEVNYAPMLELFLKLKDKSLFRRIKSFHKK